MIQIYPDEGLTMLIARILNDTVTYHLFTNALTIDRATTLADMVEAAWSGYASVDQDDTNFTLTGVTGHTGFAIAAPITFANSSGTDQTAEGYYITDQAGTKLLAAANFDGGPVTVHDGDTLPVTPTWGDLSANQ